MPKISIIVPVYNAEKYIDRCIKSIYAQSFTQYEIILVNDGSTDHSAKLCEEYAEKDNRITVIHKANEGAGSARNAGIKVAKGEYLAFPDVDDWFEPEMYQELYDLACSGDYDIVFSGVNYYQNQEGKLTYSRSSFCPAISCSTQKDCRENIMTFFPTSTIFDVPWNKLYKREVAIKNHVRFSDTKRCQDAMFNIDFYNTIHSAVSIDKAYYNYIENTAEDVQRKFPKNYIDINIAYFNKLVSTLTSWGIYHDSIKQHFDTSFVLAVYGTMTMFDNSKWKMTKAEQKQYVKDIMAREDVQKFLKHANIRKDARKKYQVIIKQKYITFMCMYHIERIKNQLRKIGFVRELYSFLRKNP